MLLGRARSLARLLPPLSPRLVAMHALAPTDRPTYGMELALNLSATGKMKKEAAWDVARTYASTGNPKWESGDVHTYINYRVVGVRMPCIRKECKSQRQRQVSETRAGGLRGILRTYTNVKNKLNCVYTKNTKQ